jgi:hypothetical protein
LKQEESARSHTRDATGQHINAIVVCLPHTRTDLIQCDPA